MQQPNSGLDSLTVEVFRSHAHARARTHTPLKERSARRTVRYLQNIQETRETKIRALSGIRTHDSSNQAFSALSRADTGIALNDIAFNQLINLPYRPIACINLGRENSIITSPAIWRHQDASKRQQYNGHLQDAIKTNTTHTLYGPCFVHSSNEYNNDTNKFITPVRHTFITQLTSSPNQPEILKSTIIFL